MIKRFDRDGDGSLSMPEFLAFIRLHAPEIKVIASPGASGAAASSGTGSAVKRFIRAVYISSARQQEAIYSQRSLEAVVGDLSGDAGATQAVKLWAEFENDAVPATSEVPFNSLIALCVVPASPSK